MWLQETRKSGGWVVSSTLIGVPTTLLTEGLFIIDLVILNLHTPYRSLMRNGVIPALFPGADQEMEALDYTVCQSIITHYAPAPVLTCVIQTILIRQALHGYIYNHLLSPLSSPPTTCKQLIIDTLFYDTENQRHLHEMILRPYSKVPGSTGKKTPQMKSL